MSYTQPVLLGKLIAANFNAANTDQPINIQASNYIVRKIILANPDITLPTMQGGIYDAPSQGGNALVAGSQSFVGITQNTGFVDMTLTSYALTETNTVSTLYFNLSVGEIITAFGDIYIFGDKLS